MVKIQFLPNTTRDGIVENMWAESVENGFRLENSPFYAYGVSYQDIVSAELDDGILVFKGILTRGGHSTYRILTSDKAQDDLFDERWAPLQNLGCTYEHSSADGVNLYSVDLAPGIDVHQAFQLMAEAEEAGAWIFEEAHFYVEQ